MSSQRQIAANRINGAKSRGPITPEGKLASSRNSLVHGLLSQVIIFDGESADRFNALHDSLIDEFQPQTPTECGLVETMVVCRWRLMRVWILENSAVLKPATTVSFPAPSSASTRFAPAAKKKWFYRTNPIPEPIRECRLSSRR